MLTDTQMGKALKIKKYCEQKNSSIKLKHGEKFMNKFSKAELCKIGGIETVTITNPKNPAEWRAIKNWVNASWADQNKDLFLEPVPGARGGIRVAPRVHKANVVARNYKISEGYDKANQELVEQAIEENAADEFVLKLAHLGITPKMLGTSAVRATIQKLLESKN